MADLSLRNPAAADDRVALPAERMDCNIDHARAGEGGQLAGGGGIGRDPLRFDTTAAPRLLRRENSEGVCLSQRCMYFVCLVF